MTENKRFTISSDNNQNIYDGEEKCYYSSIDALKLCDLLNELSTENRQLKKQLNSEHQMLDNAILLERTRMGKNSLKQFKQQLGGNND